MTTADLQALESYHAAECDRQESAAAMLGRREQAHEQRQALNLAYWHREMAAKLVELRKAFEILSQLNR